MKTIEEFIRDIGNSAALQDEIKAVKEKDALEELLTEKVTENYCFFPAK